METKAQVEEAESIPKPQGLSLGNDLQKGELQDQIENLSPITAEAMGLLLRELSIGSATLTYNDKDKVVVEYPQRKVVWTDASSANLLATPKTEDDMKQKIEAALELVEYRKTEKPPSGVVLDQTKVSPEGNLYRERFEFERTKRVLGSGSVANDIIVVKDKKTGEEHALKTMMIADFNDNEVRCWCDMTESGYVPKLYLFQCRDNKMEMHMEILHEAKTLRSIIDEEMDRFYEQSSDQMLIRPLSLFVLDGALEVISAMHDKNWTHNDLHAGNVMIQKEELKIKVLDFGLASPLKQSDGGINYYNFQKDIAQVMRLFTGLYTSQKFDNAFDRKDNYVNKLQEVTGHFSREDKEELFCLVDAAMQIVAPKEIRSYRSLVKTKLTNAMGDDNSRMDILKKISLLLFPEDFADIHRKVSEESQDVPTPHGESVKVIKPGSSFEVP